VAENYNKILCTPVQALQHLLREADRGGETMRLVRLEIDPAEVLQYVVVWTPEGPPDRATAGRSSVMMSVPPASAVSLERGLLQVLLCAQGKNGHCVEPDDDVLFVAGGDIAPQELIRIVRELERFASPSYVALLKAGRDPLCLLHVLDEGGRLSGLGGLKALGMFLRWEELKCYPGGRIRVFLPGNIGPEKAVFDAFCELLERDSVAALLQLTEQEPGQELFYIVRRSPGDDSSYQSLRLPPSVFVDTTEVGVPSLATVEILALQSQDDPDRLARTLAESAPGVGYRLQLRRSMYTASVESELEKLRMKRAEVEQRVAHLESTQQQRPYLLRFGPGQLRALAETIYAFSVESLSESEGDVRYAYQASRRAPGGCHYLLVGPRTVMRELDPLHLYANEPPIRFWLDPSWARYYPDAGNVCQVFVPEHMALSPSLHSWQAENMDNHLRTVLGDRWLRETGADTFPKDAFYVFDAPNGNGDCLDLTVLAPSDFVPPRTRLNWLSDNLTVVGGLPVAEYVSGAAESFGWERLARHASDSAAEARVAFGVAAKTSREHFVTELSVMVRDIKAGTEQLMHQITGTIQDIDKLDIKLKVLADIKARAEKDIPRVEHLIAEVNTRVQAFQDELTGVEKAMADALERAEHVEQADNQIVIALVAQRESKRAELQRELDSLRRRRRGGRSFEE